MYYNNYQCYVIYISDFVFFYVFIFNKYFKICFFLERILLFMLEKKKVEEKEKELIMEIQKVKDIVIRLEKVSYFMD